MFKIILSLSLITLLITCVGVKAVYADSNEEKQARFTEKVKAGIARLGTGEPARVKLKLSNKTKLNGYISEAGDEDFVVVDAKTGAATRVAYGDVQQVKGNNLSMGEKVAIGLTIVAAVVAVVFILESRN